MKFGNEILVLELIGIVAFAISGSVVGIKKNFDLFGIIVLSTITAVGGGVLRDIILGILPPTMFKNSLYVFVAFITAIFVFVLNGFMLKEIDRKKERYLNIINFFDAIGLGVFAVTGANCAIISGYESNAFLAIFTGTTTAIGGGMLRDMLAGKSPFVLYKDIYASAAIVGASLFYILFYFKVQTLLNVFLTISCTIGIRMVASLYHLSLPKITWLYKTIHKFIFHFNSEK